MTIVDTPKQRYFIRTRDERGYEILVEFGEVSDLDQSGDFPADTCEWVTFTSSGEFSGTADEIREHLRAT